MNKTQIDFFTKTEIQSSIGRIEELLNCGILNPENRDNPLVKSAFIELLICLRDLMYKSEKYAKRIDFEDGVVKSDTVKDVSDSIKYVRDALCHLDSDKHYLEKGNIKATYMVAYGKANLLVIGGVTLRSDYEDDVCFFFGTQKIYFKRHIIKAFEEAKNRLLPLIA